MSDHEWQRLWDRLALPYRAARLYAAEPDDRLGMPVAGALSESVNSTWHAPRPGGRKHEGVDIFAGRGTPVLSATRGLVLRTPDGGLGGVAVFVLGAGGRTYYYAHLDRRADRIEVGRVVEAGAVVGFVGNTGNARTTPPHLHFGVYTPGGAVDPLPLIVAGM